MLVFVLLLSPKLKGLVLRSSELVRGKAWPYRLAWSRTAAFSSEGGSSFGGQATNMFFLYILKSQRSGRHYIGITEDPEQRLAKHNKGDVRSTKAFRPWGLVYREEFLNKSDARRREIFLKKTARARNDIFDTIE